MANEKCSICNNELTIGELNNVNANDMLVTCNDHSKYKNYGRAEVAKMELGLIKEYPDHFKKCAICDADLTEEEIKSFSGNTFNTVCTKHKEGETMFNLSLAKEWFAFAEAQPDQPFEDNPENREKWKKFRDGGRVLPPVGTVVWPADAIKFTDLKDGQEITGEQFEIIKQQVPFGYQSYVDGNIKPVYTVQYGWDMTAGPVPKDHPSKLTITVKNSKATLKARIAECEKMKKDYEKKFNKPYPTN